MPAGTVLVPWGGGSITTPNAVIDARDITGMVVVQAPGVVIKRSKIHTGSVLGIKVDTGDVSVLDSEFFSEDAAIGWDHFSCIRCNAHDMGDDGFDGGDNTTVQDSWIHDWNNHCTGHCDGIQMQTGSAHLVIRHNTVDARNGLNDAILVAPDQGCGPSQCAGPVQVKGNLLAGGNYTIYMVDGNNGQYFQQGMSLYDNRFVRNSYQYGPAIIDHDPRDNVAVSGNVWDDDGQPFVP